MSKMANQFKVQKPAKINEKKLHCKSAKKITNVQSTTKAPIRKGEKQSCIHSNDDLCPDKGGSKKLSGRHFQSEGIHGNRERPSADGNWGSDEFTQTVGKGVHTTPTHPKT